MSETVAPDAVTLAYSGVKRWPFIRCVVANMWRIPLRTRLELIVSALASNEGTASARYYAPPLERAAFLLAAKRMAEGMRKN